MVRVGTAGWSFPDWEGVVYPRGQASSPEALTLLARLFDTLEINVTFYRPPTRRMAESWVRRVAARPGFCFAAKLWQGFTHQREEPHAQEERAFKDGIAPLREANRLGALLLQFPHSFRQTKENRVYLETLLDRFDGYPRVVEIRHISWMSGDLLEMLGARGVGFCNIDQPQIGKAAPPTTVITSGPGYVRLHGRNRANWFRRDAGRDARYDYLYSREELMEWVQRIRLMQRSRRSPDAEIFIIANNHYRGQAPANALELKSLLREGRVEVPDSLVAAFPRLADIAATIEKPGMLPL